MGEAVGTYRVLLEMLKERVHLEDLCAVGRIIHEFSVSGKGRLAID